MTRRVYLHVGLPKTGTSTIQQSLWASRERLGEHGFSVPGDDKLTQRYAVWDLLGRRIQGADQRQVPGSWNRLVDRIREDPADTVLASEELLVHARPRHVRRIVRDLAPVELNVVVTLRNLAAVVGSMWQQEILGGATWTWHDFVLAVADPEQGPPAAGVGFWLRYDLDRVLSVWGTSVPADRMHIVVVPGRDAPRGRLLELYAEAIGVDRDALVVPERLVNPAMGPVGSEIL
jgi:hypothetical protein